METRHTRALTPAEEVLLDFLARREDGSERDLDELCEARPELADELRTLYGRLEGLDGLLAARAAGGDEELLARLARQGPRSGRFEVRGEVARGGMGVVLEVWDPDLRRPLAMKLSRAPDERAAGGGRRDRVLARFLEEAQITGQLQHPGIVPVHELGLTEDASAYFTMPLVRGEEFTRIIELARERREGWSLTRALGVLIKVCEAVAFAHDKGVLHRDLKPSNVMVGRFGETYVMDWGLARVLGGELGRQDAARRTDSAAPGVTTERTRTPNSPLVTHDGDVVGTPAYMSPEQASGRAGALDGRADVYAIGAMLYHLLAGHMPYAPRGARLTPTEILAAVKAGPPRPLGELAPEVAPELADICAKAMARDADQRYPNALDLARDLEAYLGSRPVQAHDTSLAYLLRLSYRRNRAAVLTAALALAVVLVGSLAYVRSVRAAYRREQLAKDAALEAQASLQDLSDSALTELLLAEGPRLAAGVPDAERRLTGWLERADAILARDEDRRDGAPADDRGVDDAPSGAERLAALRPLVAEHARAASTLRERTLERERDAWRAAIESIAALPVYRGLRLEPQLGLVPLGPDPWSGLWEFWLALSGEEPRRAASGELELDPATAVVLVLIPPCAPRAPGERAPEPFFLGKHEVTQAQWERVLGPGFPPFARLILTGDQRERVGPLNPVESISWYDAGTFAERLGCILPSEWQWERACRAEGRGPYWWGESPEHAEGLENLLDADARDLVLAGPAAEWSDGFPVHAPVGSFEPNAYGLHDMQGNVSEWCADWFPDGVEPAGAGGRKSFRGGSWYTHPLVAESGFRQADNPRGLNQTRGLRLARRVAGLEDAGR